MPVQPKSSASTVLDILGQRIARFSGYTRARTLLLGARALAAPDRAWIFVMDGHRASEGVDAGSENLEWLMRTMAPQGAIVYNLLNRDSTQTDGAHRGALAVSREGAQVIMLNLEGPRVVKRKSTHATGACPPPRFYKQVATQGVRHEN